MWRKAHTKTRKTNFFHRKILSLFEMITKEKKEKREQMYVVVDKLPCIRQQIFFFFVWSSFFFVSEQCVWLWWLEMVQVKITEFELNPIKMPNKKPKKRTSVEIKMIQFELRFMIINVGQPHTHFASSVSSS